MKNGVPDPSPTFWVQNPPRKTIEPLDSQKKEILLPWCLGVLVSWWFAILVFIFWKWSAAPGTCLVTWTAFLESTIRLFLWNWRYGKEILYYL